MTKEDNQFDEDTHHFATFEDRSGTYFTCHSIILFVAAIVGLILVLTVGYFSPFR